MPLTLSLVRRGWLCIALILQLLLCISCASSSNTAAVTPTATTVATKQIGTFHRISGTRYLQASITQEQSREAGFLSSSPVYAPERAHNMIFLDEQTEAVHQLLPDNTSIILSSTGLPEQENGDTKNWAISWFLYALVKSDSNGDGQLSEKDQQTIAVSDAGGQGYTEMIEQVEQIYGQALPDLQTLVIIYRKTGKTFVSRINLSQRTVIRTTELPSFGADVR